MSEDPTQNLSQDGLSQILARLDSVGARLDSIDSRLGNVESRLSTVENRLSNVESRLTALEDKVDRRLQETRPIWEQVLARLDGFENRMVSFESRFDGFDRRLDSFESELHSSLRRFGRQVGQLAKDVMEVRADQSDLDRRMDQLEPKPTQ